MFQKLTKIFFVTLFATGYITFVVGMVVNNQNRLVPAGLFLFVTAMPGAVTAGALTSGKILIRRSTSLWKRPDLVWRNKAEVPIRYWSFVAMLLLVTVVFGTSSFAYFLGWIPAHPNNPPPMPLRAEFATFAIVFTPFALCLFCFLRSSQFFKSNTKWHFAKFPLPRHAQSDGLPWLIGCYFFGIAFTILLLVSPFIANWIRYAT